MGRPAQISLKTRFGLRLRQLRERAGLTQGAMARASGVSKVYYGTLERGEKAVSIDVIEKLCHGLGISPAELFDVGAPVGADPDPVELLGRKLVALARGSSVTKLDRFERIAVVFFEPEGRETKGRRHRPTPTARSGRATR